MRDKRMQCRNIVAAAACLGFLAAGARGDFDPADPFTLANIETGSTRFTNTNEVEVAQFPIPDGYNRYQITEEGDVSAVTGSWTPTNTPPPPQGFSEPANDTNITLYAWFTNETASVTLRRAEGEIAYTTVAPSPALHAALARETAGFTVRVAGRDLDAGSTGGEFDGEALDIYSLEAQYVSGTYPDGTPDQPYVTLTNKPGTYTLSLRVVNEAGNTDTTAGACSVTITQADDPPADGDRYVAVGNLLAEAPYDNWTNAAASIQTAVNATEANGETIRVWPGRYTLPTNAVYANEASNVVNLTRPLNLRSAGTAADTIIDGEGAYRAIRGAYSSTTEFLLDGFTVTNGIAPDGGGFYLNVSSGSMPGTIRNCVFVDNVADTGSGGAIAADAGGTASRGTLTISNCVFRANRMLTTGTGQSGGGAIQIYNGSPQYIYDSLFESNTATAAGRGGGALRLSRTRMHIENSRFLDNQGPTSGGATIGGGAAYAHPGVKLTFRNCLLAGNSAVRGGAIQLGENTGNVGTFVNCTVVDNTRGVYMDNRTSALPKLQLTNTVFYYNTSYNIHLRNADPGGLVTIWNSCTPRTTFDAAFDDHDNVTNAPGLIDRDAGNYRLSRGSPCVNAGLNDMNWMGSAVDLDGNPRLDKVAHQVDIGAYERVFHGTTILVR